MRMRISTYFLVNSKLCPLITQANQKSKKKETGQKAKSPMDGERSYSEASTIDPGQGEDADGREREEDDVNVTSNDKQV
jgi:hypothetical protein